MDTLYVEPVIESLNKTRGSVVNMVEQAEDSFGMLDAADSSLESVRDSLIEFSSNNMTAIRNIASSTSGVCADIRNVGWAFEKYNEYMVGMKRILQNGAIAPMDLAAFLDRDDTYINVLYSDSENPKLTVQFSDAVKELDRIPELDSLITEFKETLAIAAERVSLVPQLRDIMILMSVSTVRFSADTLRAIVDNTQSLLTSLSPVVAKTAAVGPARYSVLMP